MAGKERREKIVGAGWTRQMREDSIKDRLGPSTPKPGSMKKIEQRVREMQRTPAKKENKVMGTVSWRRGVEPVATETEGQRGEGFHPGGQRGDQHGDRGGIRLQRDDRERDHAGDRQNIALAVGGMNAGLELVQLDELVKSFKILSKSGATQGAAQWLGKFLLDRGLDVASETTQEVAQEGITIAGVQAGSKIDKGEWAYDFGEVWDRLGETAGSSALAFGAASIPGTVRNVGAQWNTGAKPRVTMAEFTDPQAAIWRNVEYDDAKTKMEIMGDTHQEMVEEGKIVRIPDETLERVAQSYPDLRTMKKKERLPILRQKNGETENFPAGISKRLQGDQL